MREDDGLFEGVVDSIQGAFGDLRSGLVRALASNIQRRDPNRTLFQLEAMRPGRASRMVPHLFATDRQWALTKAQTIVRLQPDAYKAYVDILAELKIDLYAFIHRTKGLMPDKDAESILRERMAELLEECLLRLRDPE